jgi:hypothetical protein
MNPILRRTICLFMSTQLAFQSADAAILFLHKQRSPLVAILLNENLFSTMAVVQPGATSIGSLRDGTKGKIIVSTLENQRPVRLREAYWHWGMHLLAENPELFKAAEQGTLSRVQFITNSGLVMKIGLLILTGMLERGYLEVKIIQKYERERIFQITERGRQAVLILTGQITDSFAMEGIDWLYWHHQIIGDVFQTLFDRIESIVNPRVNIDLKRPVWLADVNAFIHKELNAPNGRFSQIPLEGRGKAGQWLLTDRENKLYNVALILNVMVEGFDVLLFSYIDESIRSQDRIKRFLWKRIPGQYALLINRPNKKNKPRRSA